MCNFRKATGMAFSDVPALFRVIGGRRRYNAERRRKAEARRERLYEWLDRSDLLDLWGEPATRGAIKQAAQAFGVHPSTICRDVQRLNGVVTRFEAHGRDGAFLGRFERVCSGGPVGRMYGDCGRRRKGAARRAMLRRIPRYVGRRLPPKDRRAMPRNW